MLVNDVGQEALDLPLPRGRLIEQPPGEGQAAQVVAGIDVEIVAEIGVRRGRGLCGLPLLVYRPRRRFFAASPVKVCISSSCRS